MRFLSCVALVRYLTGDGASTAPPAAASTCPSCRSGSSGGSTAATPISSRSSRQFSGSSQSHRLASGCRCRFTPSFHCVGNRRPISDHFLHLQRHYSRNAACLWRWGRGWWRSWGGVWIGSDDGPWGRWRLRHRSVADGCRVVQCCGGERSGSGKSGGRDGGSCGSHEPRVSRCFSFTQKSDSRLILYDLVRLMLSFLHITRMGWLARSHNCANQESNLGRTCGRYSL